MARLPSLPDGLTLDDVFRRYPHGVAPLLAFHDAILRGPSPLSVGDRELIAAYVSGLNACNYCHGAHSAHARAWGIDDEVLERLIADPAQAVEPRWVPMLSYLEKLTLRPAEITDEDAAAVYEAGWSERALYDAVVVCALFCCMNRIVEGCGIPPETGTPRRRRRSYADFGRELGIVEPEVD